MNPLNPDSPKPNELGSEPSLEQQFAYLAAHLFTDHPLNRPGYSLAFRESLLTGNGMLEIIEVMRERGYELWLRNWNDGYSVHFNKLSGAFHAADGATPPEAVARAAYAALQETTRD